MASNIQAVRQQIDLLKRATTSPEAMRKLIVDTTRAEVAKIEARQGVYPKTQYVDGRENAPLESVKADGVVEVHFSVIDDVIDDIYAELVPASPIKDPSKKRGHPSRWYIEHIWVFVNGTRIDPDGPPAQIRSTDTVVFIDVAPYAAKIERGLSKRYAPNGVFEITARKMARKWSNVARITFDYRQFSGAPVYKNLTPPAGLKYPSIEIGPW